MSAKIEGSPPRMRGVLKYFLACFPRSGITPAYAGSTIGGREFYARVGDHPRVCGKYISKKLLIEKLGGSPPRMREVLFSISCLSLIIRITPAYAGSTLFLKYCLHSQQDHPRVCGKYEENRRAPSEAGGSPPRMREVLFFKA